MTHRSPLRSLHAEAEASLLPYGPEELGVELVETFGELDFEYAALRKGCVLVDQPHRATLEVTGADRITFLNNMVTQELKGLEPLRARRAFWLNRKGRIDADLRLIELDGRMLIDTDVLAADEAARSLGSYVFAEDVQIRDATAELHRLALHGPTGPALVGLVAEPVDGPPVQELDEGRACTVRIAGHDVVIDRLDQTGEVGLEMTVAAEGALAVYRTLAEAGEPHNGDDPDSSQQRIRLRRAGWHAFNVARIEAGTPLFNMDFGPASLPAETGVLTDRVSFTKGCYLGQEVVARMHALGHPKQVLVGLRPEGDNLRDEHGALRQPVSGAQVFTREDPTGAVVGAVTSSAVSPMLGGHPVCFAAVRWGHQEPGTRLLVTAEGTRVEAVVQPTLRFWTRARA